MTTLAQALKSEVVRLARKELRTQLEVTLRTVATCRRQIAELKKTVRQLEQENRRLARAVIKPIRARDAAESDASTGSRFSPKGLRSHRTRLGLTLPQAASLLGVSAQTVYNWEQEKTRPRREQIPSIVALRAMSKKEAATALEQHAN